MVEKADGLTKEVAAFIVNTNYRDLPSEVVSLAKRSLLDGIGVILAGSTEPVSVIARKYLETIGGKPESTVIGSKLRVPAPGAALANGVGGHAQDFDDTQLSSSPDRIYGLLLHPTPPVLAATFAIGEALGINGEGLLTALSVGFEVACKIADAIHPFHYIRGFHTTGTIGAFGAAAATGKLLSLSEEKMRHALGIAASMSAGIRSNFGSMTKPFHSGRAAENGVVAGRLAQLDFTANPSILEEGLGYFKIMGGDFSASDPRIIENPLWGYGKTMQAGFDLARISRKLGKPYAIVDPGISIKPFPSVVLSHPSMNTLLDLIKEYDITPDSVDEVHVFAGANVVNILHAFPRTGTEGKFSLRFCLTTILLRRRAGIKDFSDDFVRSPEAQAMMKRIKISLDPEIEAAGYAKIQSRIELRLKDGRILKKDSGPYKGGPENPLSEGELEEKFSACAELALPPRKVSQLLQLLKKIEAVKDIKILIPALLPD
jgi:2-methylcitrate dehydratase PrpD